MGILNDQAIRQFPWHPHAARGPGLARAAISPRAVGLDRSDGFRQQHFKFPELAGQLRYRQP